MEYGVHERRNRTKLILDTYHQRVLAAVEEHQFRYEYFMSTLHKCGIDLNIKMLSNLAIYEPRTFKSLVDLAKARFKEEGDSEIARSMTAPTTVITRGML